MSEFRIEEYLLYFSKFCFVIFLLLVNFVSNSVFLNFKAE